MAEEQQKKDMRDYFKPKPARGRPRKQRKHKKKSRSKTPTRKRAKGAAIKEGRTPPSKRSAKQKQKLKRKNWSSAENFPQLQKIVNGWLNRDGAMGWYIGITKTDYAVHHGISATTLGQYTHPDPLKRRPLRPGKQRGPKAENQLIHPKDRDAFIDLLVAKDRRNDGQGRQRSVQQLQTINPKLTGRQASNLFTRIHRQGKEQGRLTGTVRAQKSTSKRTAAINVQALTDWHKLIDGVEALLRVHNGDGYAELAEHFWWNLDEMCMLASDGNDRIIGDAGKRKHEIESSSSRVSITILRCGSSFGVNGPVFFLLSGRRRPRPFTEVFLRQHGAPPGSAVIMTENAFMTDKARFRLPVSAGTGRAAHPVWPCI